MRRLRIRAAVELPLLLLLVIFTAPILWMALLAVQPDRVIVNAAGWTPEFTLYNLRALFAPEEPFLTQAGNSLVVVVGAVLLTMLVATPAGYGLARLRIPKLLAMPVAGACLLLPIVPPMVFVPGFYVTLAELGLLSTLTGLILLNTVLNLPFATVMMRLSFAEIPVSLREAAIIDGAGEARVLLRIMLPLAMPGLASAGLFAAIMTWNEFLMALTMTSGGTTAPITVGIAAMVQPYDMRWGQMAAAGSVAVIPIVLLTIVANRKIVAGLTRGAVKG
jgi:multiple sugar transport system permease protein